MSNKLSTILVGVDLSEPSFNAVYTATKLAAKNNASLYLLYAHETLFERIVLTKKLPENATTSDSILTAMASDIARKSGVKTHVIKEDSNAAEVILRNIVSIEADLVVLGTYGASGYRNGYTGTTAYTVTKYAPCPVLLVPGGRQWSNFNKPFYPVRPVVTAMRHYPVFRKFIETKSSLLVFGLAKRTDEKDDSVIRETLSMINDDITNDEVSVSFDWSTDNDVSHNILTQAEKNRSDIIILTTAIDVSNKQFFIGPIGHYVIHNSRIPVLVINKVNSHTLSQVRSA